MGEVKRQYRQKPPQSPQQERRGADENPQASQRREAPKAPVAQPAKDRRS